MSEQDLHLLRLLAHGLTIKMACNELGVERWQAAQVLDRLKRVHRCKTVTELVFVLRWEIEPRGKAPRHQRRSEYIKNWRRSQRERKQEQQRQGEFKF